MSELRNRIREEVRGLLSNHSFRASDGAFLEGKLSGVEIVPRKKFNPHLCDLHFRIIPAFLNDDVPDEVLAGVRQASVEALADRYANVRFAAQQLLNSLENERVRHGDLEGFIVSLHTSDKQNRQIVREKETDTEGQIWFPDVWSTSVCSLMLEAASVELRLAAAPSDEPPLQVQAGSKPQIVYLPDRRIVALLEELVDGKAVLTLETNAEDLDGVRVRFSWRSEEGEIVLEPSAVPGTWSGQRRLNASFKDLVSAAPVFEVIPRKE